MDGEPECWRNSTEPSPGTALVVVSAFLSGLWTFLDCSVASIARALSDHIP